jgi:hypothetical protein
MKYMNQNIPIILIAILLPIKAYAVVFGATNFGFSGYPDHTCLKPNKPFKPYSFNSEWEVNSYNNDVDYYNSQLQQYFGCIDEYIEGAKNDIKRIENKAKEAIDETGY